MSRRSSDEQHSLIYMILDGMPPVVKAGVFSALALPLVLAVSAMMLQVNAGSLITKAIESRFDEQTSALQKQYALQMEQLREEVASIAYMHDLRQSELRNTNLRLTAAERRLDEVETAVHRHIEWSCEITSDEHKERACAQ